MSDRPPKSNRFYLALGLSAGGLLSAGMVVGLLMAPALQRQAPLLFPETPLRATATHSSDTLAVATGRVDEEMEGLFFLDYLTGELQCVVLNYRTGKFNSLFRTNVMKDLGVDATRKRPNYLLVTGNTNFVRGSGIARLALTVVYVVDANTGQFAAYGLPWLPDMARSGRPQTGAMILLDGGNARTALVRE